MTIKDPPHPGLGISPQMAIRLDKAFGGSGYLVSAPARMGTGPGEEGGTPHQG